MENEQSALTAFVQVHAPKAQLHKERCAFLTQYKENGISIDTVLERYTLDKITRMFEINPLTRWLINQMQTYDPDKEVIIGLIFSQENILAHVVRLKVDED